MKVIVSFLLFVIIILPLNGKISLRVFPISLNKLCQVFGVEGKTSPYNPKYNNIEFFNIPKLVNSFKKYSLQDAIALYKALFIAQLTYFKSFGVDIESIYSTSTLSLKIYRTKFQDKGGVYMFFNLINGNCYIGSSINLA